MKKATILGLALTFSVSVFSQDKKFHLGILGTAGLGWVTPESKNLTGGGAKGGLGIGLYMDYFFSENYAFNLELLHSTQGFKANAVGISVKNPDGITYREYTDVGIDYRMRSFQIPITLKLRTKEIGYMRYYAQIGIAPSFAYKPIRADFSQDIFENPDDSKDRLVNENGDDFNADDNGDIPPSEKSKFLYEDDVKAIRLPILIGLGAEWNLSGNTSVVMGFRYEYGLINMMNAEGAIAVPHVLGLIGGIRF